MSYGKVLRNSVAKRVLDLRSDTFTLPSAAMRARMAEAICGDDVYKEDRTIIELESRLAELTGHEGALFVLTCTMANFLGLAATCNRGEEVLCGDMSHIGLYEQSNVSQFTGIGMRQDLRKLSSENGCNVHMDGARLVNASIGTGITLKDYCSLVDTATMCFTKGMGCPFGAALVGNEDVIQKARRMRKAIGGQWRQGGIAAAAVLESLDDLSPIENDHEMAKVWASAIPALSKKISVDAPQTNIVIFKCQDETSALEIIEKMAHGELSVLLQQGANPEDVRAVFHRSADYSLISEAVEKLQSLI
ncbi:Oidioi.mRNA.OKI2018_I69.chr2.g7787.t1.cds [Oikopleura dioica]|uniref:Oidioi.mRNA.OKI2018_I69.chr2.g7787.t1.cds n=1 Tax=Oikopleura dioica TaxID=34765 RepID=A0ABN7TBW6_OIKDI|nr:Oidioi.mRNA.OKI2018_I69.chr2.g7787.t1.cds [Oikopleura dioica]